MDFPQTYIIIATTVFIIILWVIFLIRKQKPNLKITQLDSLSFAFIITGIIYSGNILFGYSLIGIGIILSMFNIFKKKN